MYRKETLLLILNPPWEVLTTVGKKVFHTVEIICLSVRSILIQGFQYTIAQYFLILMSDLAKHFKSSKAMKMKFYILITFLLSTFISNAQTDSLVIVGRKFLSIYTNVYNQSSKIQNLNYPEINGTNSDFSVNVSYGKFKKKGIASILTFGIIKGGNEYNKSMEKESNTGINFSYGLEKFKMISKKMAFFGGVGAGISYRNQLKRGENFYNNLTFYNESNTTETMVYANVYPSVCYFINSRWSITATIGNLRIFDFSNRLIQSFSDYTDNGELYRSHQSESALNYSFSPSFSMNNSGIGLRYFLK
jgi:hypothetical protein